MNISQKLNERRQWRYTFDQKSYNCWHWGMAMIWKSKPNYFNESVLDLEKHVKFGQTFAMAWYIMNSSHKVVRSTRNTTLKLCSEKILKIEKWIMNLSSWLRIGSHSDAGAWVFGQKENHTPTTVFTEHINESKTFWFD